jgi:hypothetical protein
VRGDFGEVLSVDKCCDSSRVCDSIEFIKWVSEWIPNEDIFHRNHSFNHITKRDIIIKSSNQREEIKERERERSFVCLFLIEAKGRSTVVMSFSSMKNMTQIRKTIIRGDIRCH